MLAKALFPRRLEGCSDPMSGFFAVRRDRIDLDRLRPQGFKILLEILARSSRLKVRELPFEFQQRHSGESKASLAEGLLFVRRLISLRIASVFGRYSSPLAKMIGFGTVGATGIAVNSAALWFFVSVLQVQLLLGAALATQVSTLWNYILSDRLVFKGPKSKSGVQRLLGFALINNVVLLARLPFLSLLVHGLGVGYLLSNIITLVAAFGVRYLVSDRYLFQSGESMTMTQGQTRTVRPTDVEPDRGPSGCPTGRDAFCPGMPARICAALPRRCANSKPTCCIATISTALSQSRLRFRSASWSPSRRRVSEADSTSRFGPAISATGCSAGVHE
jgi:putative flippase GtrA